MLEILYRVAEALNEAADGSVALEATLRLVDELMGLPTSWVWLEDAGRFFLAAARGLPPLLEEPLRMTGEPCWCLQAYRAGSLGSVNVLKCSRLEPGRRPETGGLSTHASVRLAFRDRPLGVLNVGAGRRLSAEELRLLEAIGYQLGLALERSRLAEEALSHARQDERARLARELHDTLAQDLTGASLGVEGALRALPARPEVARERLSSALDQLRSSLEEVRGSLVGLRSGLRGQPLEVAVRELARSFASRTGVRVEVSGSCSFGFEVENELFRVVQEALSNVERHSGSPRARVSLREDGLTVEDFGRGLNGSPGHGLQGMRERCRAIGARLVVRSRPGGGVRVSVSL